MELGIAGRLPVTGLIGDTATGDCGGAARWVLLCDLLSAVAATWRAE